MKPSLEQQAAAALGGPAVKPPAPVKIAPAKPAPHPTPDVASRGAEARAAFQPQSIGSHAAAPVGRFGNPTFDGPPPELAERRGKAETARRRLANLATLITAEQSALGSLLDDLADDAEALKAAEHFEVATARQFLTDLLAVVTALGAEATQTTTKSDSKSKA